MMADDPALPTMSRYLPTPLTLSTNMQTKPRIASSAGEHIPTVSTTMAKSSAWPSPSPELRDVRPLSPSPAFLESTKSSKEDKFAPMPRTPKRPGLGLRGLSLQLAMPPRDITSSSTANLSTNITNHVPLSPKLDTSPSFGSTASVLPRRSRGLDYTRACTNLHHSTLADKSSPDSSPVIGGRAMNIPRRGQSGNSGPDSPMFASSLWSSMANAEKAVLSTSVGSVNMLDSGSDTESSEDDDLLRAGDEEDTIHGTPQPFKNAVGVPNPFNTAVVSSPGADMISPFSRAAANLMSFQRRTRRGRSTRHSSSSASGHSSMPSPAPNSPPLLKSIESGMSNSYFPKERSIESRRESLSLGTGDLHISDTVESEDSGYSNGNADALGLPVQLASNIDERRNVIKRAVTRRSNLMPKPKTFARIRAALQEEISPVDTECRREAEVIRQVKESDSKPETSAAISQPATTASSPSLLPLTATSTDPMDDLSEMMGSEAPNDRKPMIKHTRQPAQSSITTDLWSSLNHRLRTPPPPLFPRDNSSGISDDVNMDTPASSTYPSGLHPSQTNHSASPSQSTTPQPVQTTGETTRKNLGKRRRDDDLDPYLFKRRAVSPGISLQNSPILPPSPARGDGGWWQTKSTRETPSGHAAGERLNSNSSTSGSGSVAKRVGLQGMTDTNDGLMNMSIE